MPLRQIIYDTIIFYVEFFLFYQVYRKIGRHGEIKRLLRVVLMDINIVS